MPHLIRQVSTVPNRVNMIELMTGSNISCAGCIGLLEPGGLGLHKQGQGQLLGSFQVTHDKRQHHKQNRIQAMQTQSKFGLHCKVGQDMGPGDRSAMPANLTCECPVKGLCQEQTSVSLSFAVLLTGKKGGEKQKTTMSTGVQS